LDNKRAAVIEEQRKFLEQKEKSGKWHSEQEREQQEMEEYMRRELDAIKVE